MNNVSKSDKKEQRRASPLHFSFKSMQVLQDKMDILVWPSRLLPRQEWSRSEPRCHTTTKGLPIINKIVKNGWFTCLFVAKAQDKYLCALLTGRQVNELILCNI